MAATVAAAAMEPRGDEAVRWAACAGEFRMLAWGVVNPIGPADRMFTDAGVPYFETSEDGPAVRHRLTEVEPGLFLADNGEMLDLRDAEPTWRTIRLVRVSGGPDAAHWAVIGLVGLMAAGWLIAAAARAVQRRRAGTTGAAGWQRIAGAVASLVAVLVLATIGLIAWLPILVDTGFLGWLNWPFLQRLALHLPLVLAVAAAAAAALTAVGWASGWWSRLTRLQYVALCGGAAVLVVQLAVWGLIGWGLG
jgi:hypothetical protein